MRPHFVAPGLLAALAFCVALLPRLAPAQSITIDGTLSPARTLLGPNYTIAASLGKQVGANLFQSFGKFGLLSNEEATFTGPASTANIIGRVTGGSRSSIDGKIVSAIEGANLFLINPFGIVFGSHATINVSGSFHASTADYLKMADGTMFSATHPDGSTFSAAPPAAFGFLSASPPAITVQGSNLSLTAGATLGLVGGPVTITGGTLAAPGGTIHIASAAGPGEIPVDPLHRPAATVTSYGPVAISGAALLDVASGGSVFIRAGTLSIDASTINADNNGAAPGGEILLQADGAIVLSGGATVHASSLGSANAGDIVVNGGTLTILANGEIASYTFGSGNAGNVSVAVGGLLTIDGAMGNPQFATGIASDAEPNSTGHAGQVSVSAGSMTILANGEISSSTFAGGNGGDVSVVVAGLLTIDGAQANPQFATGVEAVAARNSTGNAGQVSVRAGSLSMMANGEIASTTFGTGNAGDILVVVAGLLAIDGASEQSATGIVSDADAGSSGNAGTVTVQAGNLAVIDGGSISSSALGANPSTGTPAATGNAGNVTVTAGVLTVAGSGVIASTTDGVGAGGDVTIDAGTLTILTNGEISSNTFAGGNAGFVSVTVTDTLAIDASSANPQFLTGISAQTNPGSTGAGGDVMVVAGNIVLSGPGKQIAAQSLGGGKAGEIEVHAGSLDVIDGARISTTGRAAAGGNITLSVGDLLYLRAGEITTSSGGPGAGSNGGNITIHPSPVVVLADQSSITANAFGGNGGNITIDAAAFIASADSTVTASSQKGVSGTIAISGQLVGLNGALVVLPSALRGAEAILRSSCAARRALPQSSFVAGGRGGLPQDPEAVLPALYIAPYAAPRGPAGAGRAVRGVPRHTAIRLTMRCG